MGKCNLKGKTVGSCDPLTPTSRSLVAIQGYINDFEAIIKAYLHTRNIIMVPLHPFT